MQNMLMRRGGYPEGNLHPRLGCHNDSNNSMKKMAQTILVKLRRLPPSNSLQQILSINTSIFSK